MGPSSFNRRLQGQAFVHPLPSLTDNPPRDQSLFAVYETIQACYRDAECPVLVDGDISNFLIDLFHLPEEIFKGILVKLHAGDFESSLKEFDHSLHPHIEAKTASLPSDRTTPYSTPSIWASLSQHWTDAYAGDAPRMLKE